jgi:hypothetical protein
MMKNVLRAAAVAAGLIASAGAASAATWPVSVVGTWNMYANQSTLTLTISGQAAGGYCRSIKGTLQDNATLVNANVEGFYCPFSGRISFLRKDPTTNDTYQVYVGNMSVTGSAQYVAGSFLQEVTSGPVGEYDWFAVERQATGTAE